MNTVLVFLYVCLAVVAITAVVVAMIRGRPAAPTPTPPSSTTPPSTTPPSRGDQTQKLLNCPHVRICMPEEKSLQLTYCGQEDACEYGWEDPRAPRVILFHAGDYTAANLSTPPLGNPQTLVIGYYQSAMGLNPEGKADAIVAAVQVLTGGQPSPCALNNFWRSISNIQVNGAFNWFVSQAAPFRQMRVVGDTSLTAGVDGGCYASGGYGANSTLGNVNMNGNQQWLLRNCIFDTWVANMWNSVALDSVGGLEAKSLPCLTAARNTGDLRRAVPGGVPPFLAYKGGEYGLVLPEFYASNVPQGRLVVPPDAPFRSLSTGGVYVVSEAAFQSDELAAALGAGQCILFTPGTYQVTLHVTRPGTVIVGIGQPILQGTPAIRISTPDVVLTGVLLESIPGAASKADAILIVESNPSASQAKPVRVADVWVRHGAKTMGESKLLPALIDLIAIHQSYTYVENIWSWRQDHTKDASGGVGRSVAVVQHAIHVYPEALGVTCVGAQAEHSLGVPVLWEGASGTLIFLQCELPYEMQSDSLVPGLLVQGDDFLGISLGVYIYTPPQWGCASCRVPCGVQVADGTRGAKFQNVITVQLNLENGTVTSGINHGLCVGQSTFGGPTSLTLNGSPVCIGEYPQSHA